MTKETTRLIEIPHAQIKDGWKSSINRYTGETDLKPTKLSSGQLSQMLIELHGEHLRYNELALVLGWGTGSLPVPSLRSTSDKVCIVDTPN